MTELLADRKEQNVCWNYHLNRNNILNKAIRFAYGWSAAGTNPDSEQIEPTKPQGF